MLEHSEEKVIHLYIDDIRVHFLRAPKENINHHPSVTINGLFGAISPWKSGTFSWFT